MTATNKISFDTNILIYSIDLRNLEKHNLCRKIVKRCAQMGGVISLQCLTEFYRATTRRNILPPSIAFEVVAETLAAMEVVSPSEEDLLKAMRYHQTHHQQFFDALMRATMERAGCSTLLSEDFGHGSTLGSLTILNPFQLTEAGLDQLLA